MSKRIIALCMGVLVSLSIIGCGKSETVENVETKTATEQKYDELQGEWAKDRGLDDLKKNYYEILKKVEEKTNNYGLEYSKEGPIVKEVNGETVNHEYIYLENKKPEKNRLESLYFGMKIFGDDLSSGQIAMKTSLNFDGEGAIKKGEFDFGDTSLAAYSSIMTGDQNRSYKDINNKIIEILKTDNGEGVISNSINGLYEEFIVSKDFIVYRLETKKYDFAKAEEALK